MAGQKPLLIQHMHAVGTVGCLLLCFLSQTLAQGPSQQVCPEQGDISPCICTVKKNGLDILCETTDLAHITKSMGTLKGKSPVIFYLKLRHNNLPKLQGFVFLALDIRHLTIHNYIFIVSQIDFLNSPTLFLFYRWFSTPCHSAYQNQQHLAVYFSSWGNSYTFPSAQPH